MDEAAKQRGYKFHEIIKDKCNLRYVDYQDAKDKTQDEVILDGWFSLEQLKIILSAFEEVQNL